MTQPIPITLAALTTPFTADEAETQSLQICQQLGLPTTAWQPVQMIPDVIVVNATLAANASQLVAYIAQGAYASTAAAMTDSNGNPVSTWLALRLGDQYNITMLPAMYASGSIPIDSTQAYPTAWSANNPLHFANITTGATYTTVGSGAITVGAGMIPVIADLPGAGATSGTGVTLVQLTPLAGVTVLPLVTSLVGSNQETNSAALTRAQNKLGTLAPVGSGPQPVPGGASGGPSYVAASIPQASVASTVPPYAVTAPITRVQPAPSSGYGSIVVYVANASSMAPGANDVAAVDAALQALVTTDVIAIDAVAAVEVLINITFTVYVKTIAGITSANIITNIEDALAEYFSNVPIGGYTTTAPNIVPLTEISETIYGANAGTVDLVILSPTTSVSIPSNGVPASGTISGSVVLV